MIIITTLGDPCMKALWISLLPHPIVGYVHVPDRVISDGGTPWDTIHSNTCTFSLMHAQKNGDVSSAPIGINIVTTSLFIFNKHIGE